MGDWPRRCPCGSGYWARRSPAVATGGECYVCGAPGERFRAGMARPPIFHPGLFAGREAEVRASVIAGLDLSHLVIAETC